MCEEMRQCTFCPEPVKSSSIARRCVCIKFSCFERSHSDQPKSTCSCKLHEHARERERERET